MKRALDVGSIHCDPGHRIWGTLNIGAGPDGQGIGCPVAVLNGSMEGPILYVGGGTHGEELNGIEVARQVAEEVDPAGLTGGLIVVPIQNLPSYLALQYSTPWDKGDLGKSYPGTAEGSFTARMANVLFAEAIARSDVVIDVHTAMIGGEEYPQCIILEENANMVQRLDGLAHCFPVGAIVKVKAEHVAEHFGPAYAHSIFTILNRRGVPALLVEIGEGGKLGRSYVEIAVRGILNAMRHLGMLEGTVERFHPTPLTQMVDVRSPAGGLLYIETRLGAAVRRGDLLARIVAVPNRETLIRSPQQGLVLRVMTGGVVVPGDRVVVLGLA